MFLIRSASACRIRSRTIRKRLHAEGSSGRPPWRRYLQMDQLRVHFSFYPSPFFLSFFLSFFHPSFLLSVFSFFLSFLLLFVFLIRSASACRIRSRTTRKRLHAGSGRPPWRRYLQMDQLRVHFSLFSLPYPFFLSSFFLFIPSFCFFHFFSLLFVFLIRSASACRIRSKIQDDAKRLHAEGSSGRPPWRRYLQMDQLRVHFSFYPSPPLLSFVLSFFLLSFFHSSFLLSFFSFFLSFFLIVCVSNTFCFCL